MMIEAPMPIIVGAARSGTTLLRFMLDAHPELAIPPETGFIPAVSQLTGSDCALREAFCKTVTEAPTWTDFHLTKSQLEQELIHINPFTIPAGLRAFYKIYARRFKKTRWGDKTPMYCLHLNTIETLIPEAHFIHIIRDGRDVALSVRGLWFAPGDSIEAIASDWCARISVAREQGRRCRHYMEVRYEDLIGNTTDVLRQICRYIDLAYEHDMEKYYLSAHRRLEEHITKYNADGSILIAKEERLHNQRLTQFPPDQTRIARWKNEMSKQERSEFERAAGSVLQELGYET